MPLVVVKPSLEPIFLCLNYSKILESKDMPVLDGTLGRVALVIALRETCYQRACNVVQGS